MFQESASFLLPVGELVVLASAKGSVVIALVLLCRRLFANRLSARARHGLWLVALAALLIPAGFDIPVDLPASRPATENVLANTDDEPVVRASVPAIATIAPRTSTSLPGNEPATAAISSPRLTLPQTLVLLWATVAIALAAVPLVNMIRYLRIAARAMPATGQAHALLQECIAQVALRRRVQLKESPEITSPTLFGWRSPTLLLPAGMAEKFDNSQLRHVFLHELAHVQRNDICTNWVATCAQVLHWFNPVVWVGLRLMRSDMEQACDARALERLPPEDHAGYGRTLIDVLGIFPGKAPAHGLGVVDGQKQLKERIVMISGFHVRKVGSPILAMALLLGVTTVALTQPQVRAGSTVTTATISAAVAAHATSTAPLLVQTPQQRQTPAPIAPSTPTAQPAQITRVAPATQAVATEPSPATTPEAKSPPTEQRGIQMEDLIEQVAKNTNRKIIVDPRARGTIRLYGEKPEDVDFAGLLTILRIHSFTAVELNGYINVVPLASVRALAVPGVVEGMTYPEDLIVSARIGLNRACVNPLFSMMRQMVSPDGTLIGDQGSNSLVIMDTYANYKRVAAILRDIDTNTRPGTECDTARAAPAQ